MGPIRTEEEEKPMYGHFSHEHPLELDKSSHTGTTICSGCKRDIVPGKDFYTCKACSFSLHRSCFNMPRIYQHPAEPGHALNLLLLPSFVCKACGVQGSGFCYNCSVCSCSYHTLCLRMPFVESCASHEHLLKLEFSSPYDNCKGFRCDVCGDPGSDHWLYRCNECEFDVHINCIYSVPSPQFQPLISFGNHHNMVTSPTNASTGGSAAILVNGNSDLQANRIPLSSSTRSPGMKNICTVATRAPPSNTNTAYVNPGSSAPPGGNFSGPTYTYAYNPGANSTQPGVMGTGVPQNNSHGVGNLNLSGPSSAQGVMGTGVAGLVATGVLGGMGEGIGQEIVQNILNSLTDDGS